MLKLRRRKARIGFLAAVLVVIALASGCGGSGGGVDVEGANAAAQPGVTYTDTAALLQALNAGGFTCEPAGEETRGPGSHEECARAGDDIVTAWVFADAKSASTTVRVFITGIEQGGGFDMLLRGPNWWLTASQLDDNGYVTGTGHDDLLAAQQVIGGKLVEINAG